MKHQVSEPYNRTDLILELNLLNLVIFVKFEALHTGLRLTKLCLVFSIRALMSAVTPPFVSIMYAAKICEKSQHPCLTPVYTSNQSRPPSCTQTCQKIVTGQGKNYFETKMVMIPPLNLPRIHPRKFIRFLLLKFSGSRFKLPNYTIQTPEYKLQTNQYKQKLQTAE